MPLVPGQIANEVKGFILNVNKLKQEDAETAIDAFCQQIETSVFEAIKSITITILPGFVQVAGSSGPSVNPKPIILKNSIS